MAMVITIVQSSLAQKTYSGQIFDAVTHLPLGYVSVRSLEQGKTAISDRFGRFKLNLVADTATLQISCIGYEKRLIKTEAGNGNLLVSLARGTINLKEVQISADLNNAAFHMLSSLDLNLRPINSSQDLMRLVPGLFIAQHMGGGKAEQIFIRGFDADHGTDVNISVDDMPVNMVSHIHGQGYADLHFLIPETVASYDFGKGPYYTEKGDLTTAGYINYTTKDALEHSQISLEGGRFNTMRAAGAIDLLSATARLRGENAYIAGEYNYTNGPFQLPENYKRSNLFAKYTKQLSANNKLSISASTFSTRWRATGEIPERAAAGISTAVDENGAPYQIVNHGSLISRFGAVDSAQGGKSTRVNAIVKLVTNLNNSWTIDNQLYFTHYTFLLHVNSTFFAGDSVNGDERVQYEKRDMFGYNGKLNKQTFFGKSVLGSTLGLSTRFDRTYGSDYSHVTENYIFLDNITHGDINQNNSAVYLDEMLQNGKWLLNAGMRLDYFRFNYQSDTKTNLIASPKINIQYTVNPAIQFYVKTGKGFHSNNAVAVIGNNGLQTLPAAYGTDIGLNWKPVPRLYINAAVWYLYLQQEFVYTDDGDLAEGGKTKRKGIDLSARYQLTNWLYANLNVNLAKARLADSTKGTGYLALAPGFTSTGGLDFKLHNGINGGLSYRYMHKRPGNNTYTLTADGYYVADLKINYTRKRYEIGLTIENLLNTKWNEFESEEVSRLKGETGSVDQMSFTPGTPFFAKLRAAVFF